MPRRSDQIKVIQSPFRPIYPSKKQVNLDRGHGILVYRRRYRLRARHQVAHCSKRDCPRSLDHDSQVDRPPVACSFAWAGRSVFAADQSRPTTRGALARASLRQGPELQCQHTFVAAQCMMPCRWRCLPCRQCIAIQQHVPWKRCLCKRKDEVLEKVSQFTSCVGAMTQ